MEAINKDNRRIWDANASFWDQTQRDTGNTFQRTIIHPAAEEMLGLPGKRYDKILEIGCGNGVFTRRLVELEAAKHIVATDFSENQLSHARSRTESALSQGSNSEPPLVEFRNVDAVKVKEIKALGECVFDVTICNMALMDMPTIQPLLAGLHCVLKPAGTIIVAVPHPCFNSNSVRVMEKYETETGMQSKASLKLLHYLTMPASKGVAVPGQPELQYYFHRPLHELLRPFFEAGFALTGMLEPPAQAPADYSPERANMKAGMWYEFREFPFAAVFQFCRL